MPEYKMLMGKELEKLSRVARRVARHRKHDLTAFDVTTSGSLGDLRQMGLAHCRRCKMEVQILDRPSPNETKIAGEAMALNCKGTVTDAP